MLVLEVDIPEDLDLSGEVFCNPYPHGLGQQQHDIDDILRGGAAGVDGDLGLNPASMGDLIRVPMPMMTEERRKELTKVVRSEGENAKIAIRNLRREANDSVKKLEKDKVVSEDEQKRSESDIQKVTDRYIAEVDKLVTAKEQEIMAV